MTTAHVVPVMVSTELPHELGAGECWCQPVVKDEPPDGRIVIHRRYMDGPAIDPDDDKGWFTATVGDDELSAPVRVH